MLLVSSNTIDLATPAKRISISDFEPSGFTRSSASSSEYLIPLFTQTPGAVATNSPSFNRVTRTPEPWVSKVSSYVPGGTCAPFRVTTTGNLNGRGGSFFAKTDVLARNTIRTGSKAGLFTALLLGTIPFGRKLSRPFKIALQCRICELPQYFFCCSTPSASSLPFGKQRGAVNVQTLIGPHLFPKMRRKEIINLCLKSLFGLTAPAILGSIGSHAKRRSEVILTSIPGNCSFRVAERILRGRARLCPRRPSTETHHSTTL